MPSESVSVSRLRTDAESKLEGHCEDLTRFAADGLSELVNELRLHQLELEMQNEELSLAKEELSESRNQYMDLYDFAPVGYLTVNDRDLFIQANLAAADLLGVERVALIQRSLSAFIVEEDQEKYYDHRRRLLETARRQTCELRMRTEKGQPFWVKMVSLAVEVEPVGYRIRTAITDITQRKQAEEQLRRAHDELESEVEKRTAELTIANGKLRQQIAVNEEIEQHKHQLETKLARVMHIKGLVEIASSLAHELNQPLGAIVLHAEVLAEKSRMVDTVNTAELIESATAIAQQSHRAGRILWRMKELIEEDAPKRSAVMLGDVLGEILPLVEKEIRETSVVLGVDVNESLPAVIADETELQQVLLSLMQNAMKALEGVPSKTRRIDIRARARDEQAEILVSHTGGGLSADKPGHVNRMLQSFFPTAEDGLGMELATSRSIIESHGGHMAVTPNPERGVTFTFTLPIAAEESDHGAKTDNLRCRGRSGRDIRS